MEGIDAFGVDDGVVGVGGAAKALGSEFGDFVHGFDRCRLAV